MLSTRDWIWVIVIAAGIASTYGMLANRARNRQRLTRERNCVGRVTEASRAAPASREIEPPRVIPPFNVLRDLDEPIVWDMTKARKSGASADRLAKVITATTTNPNRLVARRGGRVEARSAAVPGHAEREGH